MQAFLVDSGDHTAVSAVKSVEFVGNRTECALLLMLRGWGHDYKSIRDSHRTAIQKVYTFSSATKMASVLVQLNEDTHRLYVKVSSMSSGDLVVGCSSMTCRPWLMKVIAITGLVHAGLVFSCLVLS